LRYWQNKVECHHSNFCEKEIKMTIIIYFLSGLPLLMSMFIFSKLKSPRGWYFIIPKIITLALSPYWVIIGVAGAILGIIYQAIWAIPIGIIGAILNAWYIWGCARAHNGFEDAFGADWAEKLQPEQIGGMLKRHWLPFAQLKKNPKPTWERDVPFWTVPGTDRQVLCDIWSPSDGKTSRLAYIYFHGSGWGSLDKDYFTRPIFHHLVSQGHTVMDVAYRLVPEVDIYGMIGDVKRAIVWMKDNAGRYGVNPEKIVLGGSSAGGHLALLAGYAPSHPALTPEDLKNVNLTVRGIIAFYGSNDLLKGWDAYNLPQDLPLVPVGTKIEDKKMNFAGRVDILLGGKPDEVPDMYQLACPTTHVTPDCPPTLLVQGDRDFIVPVQGTYELYKKLIESGVPAINRVIPWADHIFDLILPQVSPSAQTALYDMDRFLALLSNIE
jgi:acetyl esterase/lipase